MSRKSVKRFCESDTRKNKDLRVRNGSEVRDTLRVHATRRQNYLSAIAPTIVTTTMRMRLKRKLITPPLVAK